MAPQLVNNVKNLVMFVIQQQSVLNVLMVFILMLIMHVSHAQPQAA